MPNVLTMSYVQALVDAVKADNAIVALARAYHNGEQDTYMTDRVREFLDVHKNKKFCVNICRTITLAVKDELSVSGFNTTEKADKEGSKTQAAWAWNLWTKNQMDNVQSEVHESALSERETFIMLEWDYDKERIKFTHNYRFTDLDSDPAGDGQGVWMIYENDDVNQKPICAVKEWSMSTYDQEGQLTLRRRRNIYYPNEIQKWVYDTQWEHYTEPIDLESEAPPEPWPIPWVGKDNKPLGIPVIHFRNVGLMPEAWDAIPLQDAANKTLIDILASNDLTAFKMLVAMGWYPTTDGQPPKDDGSNLLKVGPGQFIGSANPNAKVDVIEGSDPGPLMGSLQDIIVAAAQITSTPTARFTTTKLIAAAETLKMQDMQLKKKAKDRRVLFGNSWEQCLVVARRMTNFFGSEPELDEEIDFSTIWADNETLEDLQQKKDIGVPQETIWSEAGYSQEQIALMKKSDEYQLQIMGKIWPWISKTPESVDILNLLLTELGFTVQVTKPEPEPEPEPKVDEQGNPINVDPLNLKKDLPTGKTPEISGEKPKGT